MSGTERAADVLDTPAAGSLVVRGGMVRLVGFVAGTLFALVAAALLARHLGVIAFGRFQVVLSLVTIVGVLTDLGMTNLGIREYTQRQGRERHALMRALLGMRLTLTLVGIAGVAVFCLIVGYDRDMVAGAVLLGLGLIVLVVQSTIQIPLNATLRLPAVTALDVGRQAMQAALTAGLVAAGVGLLPFFGVTIPVHLVLLAWTAAIVGGGMSILPSFSARDWFELARPAIPFAMAVAVGIVYVYTAQILLSLVASGRETGLFSAAFRVYIILAAIPSLLVAGALPLLSRTAQEDQLRLASVVKGLFAGMILLGGLMAVACVIGAGSIIEVVAGPRYSGAVPVLRVLGLALLFSFALATWGFTLLARHQHRVMVFANLASFVVSALSVLILSAKIGAEGAAFGTLLGETLLAATYLVALTRQRPDLMPDLSQIRGVVIALAAAAAIWLVPVPDLPRTAIAVLVYSVVAQATGAVPEDIVAQLRAPLRRGHRG